VTGPLEPTEILGASGPVRQAALPGMPDVLLPGPPDGWPLLFPDVTSNYDGAIDEGVARRLQEGGCCSPHAALNFHGIVWFEDGRWHERVSVHHVAQAVLSAGSLEDLRDTVNNEFGWQ
jgi:hypothetical protein